MSNKAKIELVASLLSDCGHEVDIISHGEVIEPRLRFYRGFWERELFRPEIPIYYISSLPIKRLNGFWSGRRAVRFLEKQHRLLPYDLMIVFNLKAPQVSCSAYASRHLGIPLILQYEDDAFVDVNGEADSGILSRYHRSAYARTIKSIAGCMAVSPRLLEQVPPRVPRLLLRGVVGDDVFKAGRDKESRRLNRVVFAGTHVTSNGVKELITAWQSANLYEWQLHITGVGELTEELRKMSKTTPNIIFHGLVERSELIRLLSTAKICINPHLVSRTPGNVFAFKIIEYLAAGAHVITTPMGTLEPKLERGITYMPDNSPETIAATLKQVISSRGYQLTAAQAALETYGPEAVSRSLDELLQKVMAAKEERPSVDARVKPQAPHITQTNQLPMRERRDVEQISLH